MTTICRPRASAFARFLGEEQYAVGVDAATEKLAFSVQTLQALYPHKLTIQLDAKAAFNNIHMGGNTTGTCRL